MRLALRLVPVTDAPALSLDSVRLGAAQPPTAPALLGAAAAYVAIGGAGVGDGARHRPRAARQAGGVRFLRRGAASPSRLSN
jgi:hypothetical protein